MPSVEIQEFAKILIENVRDDSIECCDGAFLEEHDVTKCLQEAAQKSPEELAKALIPSVVDYTIFYLLNAIDNSILKVSFTASNGKTVDLTEEGLAELAGWYAGAGGWCEQFSKQRIVDD